MPELRTTPRHLPDAWLSEGVTWAATDEIARRLAVPPERVKESLKRERAAGRNVSITQGAWLVVPPEFLRWGAPPPNHDVDAWMRHLGHPYFVGRMRGLSSPGRDRATSNLSGATLAAPQAHDSDDPHRSSVHLDRSRH